MFELDLIPIEEKRVRSLVVDDDSSIAIEDPTSRRQDRRALNSVSLRRLDVNIRILYLELPETRDQKDKYCDGKILKDSDLSGGLLRVVPRERVWREFALGFVLGIDC